MILDSTTKSIQVSLGGAVSTTQLPITASWIESSLASPYSEQANNTNTNGTTPVTIVGAPGAADVQRALKFLTVFNSDTIVQTITVYLVVSATLVPWKTKILAPGESMEWSWSGGGWKDGELGTYSAAVLQAALSGALISQNPTDATPDNANDFVLTYDTSANALKKVHPSAFVSGAGSVIGPAVAVDNDIVVFDGTTGKLVKDSGKLLPAGSVVGTIDAQVLSNKSYLGQNSTSGATTTSPGWYSQLTGDTVPRVRIGLNATDVASLGMGSGAATRDLFLERAGAAFLRQGGADVAAPVAQTTGVQNVLAGTTNTAGVTHTLKGSAGTGTGAGGDVVFQVAPAGSTGSAQNAYSNGLVVKGDGTGISTVSLAMTGTLSMTGSLTSVVALTTATMHITQDGGQPVAELTGYTATQSGPQWISQKARGTGAAPTHVVNLDLIGNFRFQGYGATGFKDAGAFIIQSIDPSASDTSMGTQAIIQINSVGSISPSSIVQWGMSYGMQMFGANTVIDQNRVFLPTALAPGTQRIAPATGFSQVISNNIDTLLIHATATLATGSITMPTTPVANQVVNITTDAIITLLTLSANTGQTLAGTTPTTITPDTPLKYKWSATDTKWFKTL